MNASGHRRKKHFEKRRKDSRVFIKQHNMREWFSGRMPPCQGGSRGSESRLPLQKKTNTILCSFSFYAGERERTLRNDMKWDDYVLCNITQNNFEINSIRKVRAKPAVVLSDWWWDKVCSVPLLIKVIHNAEAIPSPARGKATIFCIVAIIKTTE